MLPYLDFLVGERRREPEMWRDEEESVEIVTGEEKTEWE